MVKIFDGFYLPLMRKGEDFFLKKDKEKLHIAMLGHKRIPSREGGIEIVVEELSTRMAALGYSVTCFNRGGHHVSGKEFDTEKVRRYKGVRLITVPTLDKKGFAAITSSFFAAQGPINTTFALGCSFLILRAVATMGVSSLDTLSIISGNCFFASMAQAGQQEVRRNGIFPVFT